MIFGGTPACALRPDYCHGCRAAALLIPTTAHAAPAAAPGETITLPVRDAHGRLPIDDEDRTGYERTAFKHWVDADRDGCSTRTEVLLDEAVVAPEQGARCAL
ncbi:hypothetical protein [Streptomyces sp. YIM B13508]|uniref:hypothetical protein n=1 Tax=Streptomyces sp. YIM B13508 TaxID=3366315 RepID=UPI003691DF43